MDKASAKRSSLETQPPQEFAYVERNTEPPLRYIRIVGKLQTSVSAVTQET